MTHLRSKCTRRNGHGPEQRRPKTLPETRISLSREGLLETIEILSDPKLMNHLKKGIDDVKAGRTLSLSEAHERIGL